MKRIIITTLFIAMVLLLGSGRAAAQAMDPNTLKPRTGADFDLYFMRNIITNHQIDVELLRPAPTNAKHAEIKSLALSLMSKRQQEADQLIGWLNDWYHNQPDTSMTATLIHMKAMPSMDMASLNEALHQIADLDQSHGDAYDKQVMLYLIRDHQLAIEAANLVPGRAARPELKPFAQSLIAEEQGEIDQFTAWLGQWYQVDSRGLPLARTTPTHRPATAVPPPAPTATSIIISAATTPIPPTLTTAEPPTAAAPNSTDTPTGVTASPTAGAQATASAAPTNIASPTISAVNVLSATAVPLASATPPAPAAASPSSASGSDGGWIIVGLVAVAVIAALGGLALRRRTPAA